MASAQERLLQAERIQAYKGLFMKYRRQDPDTGEYNYGNAKNDFLTGVEAVAQAIGTKLNLFTGEWWENQLEGLPLYTDILGQMIGDADIPVITNIYLERILETPNTTEILSYDPSFDFETREYSLSAKVNTAFGTTTINA